MRSKVVGFESFGDFVDSNVWLSDEGLDRMFRPQAFWLAEASGQQLAVDRVCRVESFDDDFRCLLRDLGVKEGLWPAAVPRLDKTKNEEEEATLSAAQCRKVAARYAPDLEIFGYSL
jgi:hypothetical protein